MSRKERTRFDSRFFWMLVTLVLIGVILLSPLAPENESSVPETTVPEATSTPEITAPPVLYPIYDTATLPPASTLPPEAEQADGLWTAFHTLRSYALKNGLNPKLYTTELAFLYMRNPGAQTFCREYPRLRNKESTADMTAYENAEGVPLFLQWDLQWGYFDYDGSPLGLAGCGPTTLAMAAYYFTGDPDMNPLSLAKFAMDYGYRYPGNGTAWSFMSSGARQLGLHSETLPLHKETMIQALENGALIICIMGPGHFTTSGHFILLTGYEDGAFTVNDCNSIARSQRTWTYEEIYDQIWNLWAITG